MKELQTDLWSLVGKVDVLCITTNGDLRKDGWAVMGKGCAGEANQKWAVGHLLGRLLREKGNFPHPLGLIYPDGSYRLPTTPTGAIDTKILWDVKRETAGTLLMSFPTKEHWRDDSNLDLIEHSLILLRGIHDGLMPATVALPRPGCQNGNLSWDEVRPLVDQYLNDWFWIISRPGER